jgi:hypothetical protein
MNTGARTDASGNIDTEHGQDGVASLFDAAVRYEEELILIVLNWNDCELGSFESDDHVASLVRRASAHRNANRIDRACHDGFICDAARECEANNGARNQAKL